MDIQVINKEWIDNLRLLLVTKEFMYQVDTLSFLYEKKKDTVSGGDVYVYQIYYMLAEDVINDYHLMKNLSDKYGEPLITDYPLDYNDPNLVKQMRSLYKRFIKQKDSDSANVKVLQSMSYLGELKR